ncbi:hypothetical protein [Kitasatospora cathayae]|uniref:Uncharacterized protein n=1 Tax=Kitasatospora cathayae TaxID=3004092 RepID=A0ABY7QEY1_9ACTN|nr:hypothetical protein [Kitasatospora sp. HUAS 3-15]WBP91320.1 hypothetical protein O1G21_39185 [Kitasatospora sp. HUAS 3-15]
MPADLLTAHDHALVTAVTALATTPGSPAARIVLAQGRLLAPAPWPRSGAPRRGSCGQCHPNALRIAARLPGAAYVEGYALTADGTAQAHAWCATADGTALDPTRPEDPALAYLGVPMTPAFVLAFQKRTLTKTRFRGVLDPDVQARDAGRIYQAGVPTYGVLDVGRIPPASDQPP